MANVLGAETAVIQNEAKRLTDLGADVRIVTTGATANLDLDEDVLEKSCASWQAPNGSRKSTLLALVVSPASRKMGLYYGASWSSALDGHWNAIKSEQMGPKFKGGDWAGGFVAAEKTLASTILEFQHPTPDTPVDLSGLWSFLLWLLGISGTFAAFMYYMSYRQKRKQEKAEIVETQSTAMQYKNLTTTSFNRANQYFDEFNLYKSNPFASKAKSMYDSALSQFTDSQSSLKLDPSDSSLSTAEYRSISSFYSNLRNSFDDAVEQLLITKGQQEQMSAVLKQKEEFQAKQKAARETQSKIDSENREERRKQHTTNNDTSSTNVVIVDNSTSEPRHHSSDDGWSGSSSSSSWGSGGGSSDFGSSSDSGGGSSSFDSGSSGGGGSSDF